MAIAMDLLIKDSFGDFVLINEYHIRRWEKHDWISLVKKHYKETSLQTNTLIQTAVLLGLAGF